MFGVVSSRAELDKKLLKYMRDYRYEIPDPRRLVFHKDLGEPKSFPALMNFTNIYLLSKRIVYVKLCSKKLAKSIVYPTTNKVPYSTGQWKRFQDVSVFKIWQEEAIVKYLDDYRASGQRILLPPVATVRDCEQSGKPLLASYTTFNKQRNDALWIKIFVISQSKAKELVYYGKPVKMAFKAGAQPTLHMTGHDNVVIGYKAGAASSHNHATNYKITNSTPTLSYMCYTNKVHSGPVGVSYYDGYYDTENNNEEEEENENIPF